MHMYLIVTLKDSIGPLNVTAKLVFAGVSINMALNLQILVAVSDLHAVCTKCI